MKGEPIRRPSIPESFNVLVKELQALGLKVELLKFKDDVPPVERAKIDEGEIETVELQSRVEAEEEGEEMVPAGDKIAELNAPAMESEAEVKAGIEEGDVEVETAKDEMAKSVSEEEMENA